MTFQRTAIIATVLTLAPLLAGCPPGEPPPEEPPAEEPQVGPRPDEPTPPQPPDEDAPPGVTEGLVEEGRALFAGRANCFVCHGPEAEGTDLGPDLSDGEWIHLERGDLVEIETVIRTGVTTPVEYPTPMPAMGGVDLSDEDVEALAAYLSSLNE